MEPALSIIKRLGGPAAVAAATGVHRTRVWNWTQPREKGGTGGLVPQRHHVALLVFARKQGIALAAEDFIGMPAGADAPPSSEGATA